MAVDLAAGTELGGFRLEELVGRGGMGVVDDGRRAAFRRPFVTRAFDAARAAV